MSRRDDDADEPETLSGLTVDDLAPSAFRVFARLQGIPEAAWNEDYLATEPAWRAVAQWAAAFSAEDPGDGEGIPFAIIAEKARTIFLIGIGAPPDFEGAVCNLLSWEGTVRHLFGAINCEPNESWKLAQTEATWPAWASRRAAAATDGVKS